MTPTWESAVRIYLAVLDNKNASAESRQTAREEIVFLAKTMDKLQEVQRAEAEHNG